MVCRLAAVLVMVFITACSNFAGGMATQVTCKSISINPPLTLAEMPAETATPLPTVDPATLPATCLDEKAASQVVEGWLNRKGYATLKEAWQAYLDEFGEDNLVSSTTDYNNEFAHAVTWQKMLLVGEFPFRVEIDGVAGIGYCAVLVYQGGVGPEVGMGITDMEWKGEWSGYASGLVESKEAARTYLLERVGKAVTVRYMVAQNPQDVGFERAGFFSPLMRRLWDRSITLKSRLI